MGNYHSNPYYNDPKSPITQKQYVELVVLDADEKSAAWWIQLMLAGLFFSLMVVHSVGVIFWLNPTLAFWKLYIAAISLIIFFTICLVVCVILYMCNRYFRGSWRYNRAIYTSTLWTTIVMVFYVAYGADWLQTYQPTFTTSPVITLGDPTERVRSFTSLYYFLAFFSALGAYTNIDAIINYLHPEVRVSDEEGRKFFGNTPTPVVASKSKFGGYGETGRRRFDMRDE